MRLKRLNVLLVSRLFLCVICWEMGKPTGLKAEASTPPEYMPIEEAGRPPCPSSAPCEIPPLVPVITPEQLQVIHQWIKESVSECGDPLVENRFGRAWCYMTEEFGSTSGGAHLIVEVRYQVFNERWAITRLEIKKEKGAFSEVKKLEFGAQPEEGYVACGGCQGKRDVQSYLFRYNVVSENVFQNPGESKGSFIRVLSHADGFEVVQEERIAQVSDGQGGYSCQVIPSSTQWERLRFEVPRKEIVDYLRELTIPWSDDSSFSTAFDFHEFHMPTTEWRKSFNFSEPSSEVDACGYIKSIDRKRREDVRTRITGWDHDGQNTSPEYPLESFRDWGEEFQFSFADPNTPPVNFIDLTGTQSGTGSYIGLVRLVE